MGKRVNSLGFAIGTIILAIFLFDVQGAIIKYMGDRYPVEQIVFFRNVFGIFPSLLVLFTSREWHSQGRRFATGRTTLALGRGVLLVGAQLSFYVSLIRLDLAIATTLAFAGPLFITTLSIPLLGHRVGWWRGGAVVLGFVGVLLIMRPSANTFTVYYLFPVLAAFFYALSSLTSRFFSDDIPTAVINTYASMSTIVLSGFLLVAFGQPQNVASLHDWLWLIGMGTVGGFAVLLLIAAYRMTEPGNLSPFEYFGIPFSFMLGLVFFDESPLGALFPGVLLIVSAGLIVIWREKRLADSAES